MVYMNSAEYLKQRKDGNVVRKPEGYFLKDGRQFRVDDGCIASGIHDVEPPRKHENFVPYVDPTGAGK